MTDQERLKAIYKAAAAAALEDNVDPGSITDLVFWIRTRCKYNEENEYFLVLGIGAELADLRAQSEGYGGQCDKAFSTAVSKLRITGERGCTVITRA